MEGLIIYDHKQYYYNIRNKVMFHVPNPAALALLKSEYKKDKGKDIEYMKSDQFPTLKALIKGKSI